MPVIEVKLYDRRVTEESVPKMIEALTNALHESSGAAIEHIQVIIQGVSGPSTGASRGQAAAPSECSTLSRVRRDGRDEPETRSPLGTGLDRLRLARVQQRRAHDELRPGEVVELRRYRDRPACRARSRLRCAPSRGTT